MAQKSCVVEVAYVRARVSIHYFKSSSVTLSFSFVAYEVQSVLLR